MPDTRGAAPKKPGFSEETRFLSAVAPGDGWWALALGVAVLILYAVTLAPTVATVFDDSLEFQIVLPALGIAHPTGYPLYTLLGWLFSLLPVGDDAFRVNLLSTVAGAAALSVMFLAARQLGSSRLAAAAMSVTFAVSSIWWSQATIAEVYTLHGLFVALILLLTLLGNGTRSPWLALVFGLSLAHHRMTLLLAPGVLVYLLWNDPGVLRRPRDLGMLAGAFLLPLLLYAWLPLRGLTTSSLDGTYINTVQGFLRHVLASDYGSFLSSNPLAVERPAGYPLNLLTSQVGLLGLLLGLAGWLRFPQQPRRLTLLALVFAVNMIFAAAYKTADVDVFYIPAIMVWLLVASVGLTILLDSLGAMLASTGRQMRFPGPYKAWLAGLSLIVLAVVLARPAQEALATMQTSTRLQACNEVLAVGETPALTPNRRGDWNVFNCGQAILDQPLPENAVIIGLLGETSLVRFMQQAHDLRPDITTVTADDQTARLQAVAEALAGGKATYVTREMPGLAETYSLTAQGPLIRVWPAGEAMPDPLAHAVDVPFGDQVRLVGYDYGPLAAHDAALLRLQLAWQVDAPVGEELKVSARLLDASGEIVASQDAVPVHWAYPTTAWRPGETVIDAYDFVLPADIDPSTLTPLVILYRSANGEEVGRFSLQ
ncbi:MAG: DUF2723 domain-containing protein [Anaerolineae bacterium]|nr:DUF2723 domain-containing protein [Anaerolineae bacterium]